MHGQGNGEASFLRENYTRSSRVFESGFTGFRGLTITSLVWWEDYYMVLSFSGFSPLRYASAKRRVKVTNLYNPQAKNEDVL